MRPWNERSPELAALFNPAFCGIILYISVVYYQKQDRRGMPLPIVFVLLPVLLSSGIRSSLPQTARTPFHLWLDRAPQIKISLAKRAANLSSITREALMFLIQRKRLLLNGDRVQKGKIIRGLQSYYDETPELDNLVDSARILGTMFGKVNDAGTVFTSLGLTV
jgi:Family of unknown function (DUF6521)